MDGVSLTDLVCENVALESSRMQNQSRNPPKNNVTLCEGDGSQRKFNAEKNRSYNNIKKTSTNIYHRSGHCKQYFQSHQRTVTWLLLSILWSPFICTVRLTIDSVSCISPFGLLIWKESTTPSVKCPKHKWCIWDSATTVWASSFRDVVWKGCVWLRLKCNYSFVVLLSTCCQWPISACEIFPNFSH